MSSPTFMFDGADPAMNEAYESARKSFKYFWRELSWERQRIVPALDMAVVKLPFTDGERDDGKPSHEHMWISEVEYDGETIAGQLMNSPNWITSVEEGDVVQMPLANLTDWMFAVKGQVYGGFTINLMRSRMDDGERKRHDDAWGLDFGDPTKIRLQIEPPEKPKAGFFSNLFGSGAKKPGAQNGHEDHPACAAILPRIKEQLDDDPKTAREAGSSGLLHREAMAGNFGIVRLLIARGADPFAKSPSGHTAAKLARDIGWQEIADYLEQKSKPADYPY